MLMLLCYIMLINHVTMCVDGDVWGMNVCKYLCIDVLTSSFVQADMHEYVGLYICMYIYIYVCWQTCINLYM